MAYPYTFVTLQSEVISRLRLDSVNDLTMVKNNMNRVYAHACIKTEALQAKTTVSPSAGGSYTLTSAVLRIRYIQLTVGSVGYPLLIEKSLEEILSLRAQATSAPVTGPPQYYAVDGSATIEVYPNFLGNESMDIWAVNAPTALSGDTDVPVLPEPYGSAVLIYGTLVEMADFSKDMLTGAQGYAQQYQYWLAELRQHLNRRTGARVQQLRVAGSGSFVPHDPSSDVRSWSI